MDYLGILLGVAVVQLLGAASPGPTFAIVSSSSIMGSRLLGLLAACGVLTATLTWALLAAIGLGVVILRFPVFYTALKLAGAAYLVWLGARMLIAALRTSHVAADDLGRPTSLGQAFRSGLLTNILNPKSIAYYSSIFAVMIPTDAPSWLLAAAVGTALLVSALWWFGVALFFSVAHLRSAYQRLRRGLDMVIGGVLIGLGMRLALSR